LIERLIMKKISFFIAFVMLVTALFVSCSSEDKNSIVGEWDGNMISPDGSQSIATKIVFTNDGRFTMTLRNSDQSGSYTILDNVLTMVADGVSEEYATITLTFEIKDGIFTASSDSFTLSLNKKDEEADKKLRAALIGNWKGTMESTSGEGEAVPLTLTLNKDGTFLMSVADGTLVREGPFTVSGNVLTMTADDIEGPDAKIEMTLELKGNSLKLYVPGSVFNLTK